MISMELLLVVMATHTVLQSTLQAWEVTTRAVTFITNMAAIHALPLPGRNPTNKDECYLLLPSDINKAFVHRRYKEACAEDGCNPFQRRKFKTLWNEVLPCIVTAHLATDLYFNYQQNNKLIQKSINLPESVKCKRLQQAQRHMNLAHTERAFYNLQCKATDGTACTPSSMHYSYDFEQVHFHVTHSSWPGIFQDRL